VSKKRFGVFLESRIDRKPEFQSSLLQGDVDLLALPFFMHTILARQQLCPNVIRLDVWAPRLAEIRQPGQFVIAHLTENFERVPLTIADASPRAGSIALVFQAAGKSTRSLLALKPGEAIRDISGPLGNPTEIIPSGHALCIGSDLGAAVVHPIARELHQRTVRVSSIIGGPSKEWIIFSRELQQVGDLAVFTEDGSSGRKGSVIDAACQRLARGGVDIVYAAGPVPMMRAVSNLTRLFGVRTIVSLNPMMIDVSGVCGGCRVNVGAEARFACVDGPEFDGHLVNFDELVDRVATHRRFGHRHMPGADENCRIE
jgi:ferredoxin/flavodoxin---NADP+ reductase